MPQQPRSQSTRPYPQLNLAGGLNNARNELAIDDSQTPDCLNIDFDRDSCATTRGSIKFNNQTAPRSAIRTRTSLMPLYFKPGYSVPLRGYGYLPYDPDKDRGGQFQFEGDFSLGTQTFHNRRGRTFQLDVSFEVPIEERLYERQSRGVNAVAIGSEAVGSNPPHGFDEALDECTCIIQKGGDRTAPMSWALAIVNIGDGTGTSAPAGRASNYALVFMWLDAPQWGESAPGTMRYDLTTGNDPALGAYSTQAYRSILIHRFIEPGKQYHVAFQVKLDSGTQGSTGVATDWNDDGVIGVVVKDESGSTTTHSFVDAAGAGVATRLEVHRGPTDSLKYLARYGIRYSGRDADFLGLGQRFLPWQAPGFIPFGSDLTSIDKGGFQMVDHSAVTAAQMYGGGVYTLTVTHTAGDAFVVLNHQGLSIGNTNGGISPWAIGGPGGYTTWTGLTNGATLFNPDALRNYKLVALSDFNVAAMRGGICNILSYSEAGASYRLTITDGATAAKFGNWAASNMLIQCYRWNQRELIIGEVRFWSAARDILSGSNMTRTLWSLGRGIDLKDTLEPGIQNLCAYYPCDDADGSLLRERVRGGTRNGHLLPFTLSTTDGGSEGTNMVMLSGEGEAPCIDLSENAVFQREIADMLAGTTQGFALELSCVFTEAFYAIQDNTITLPDFKTTGTAVVGSRPLFVPEIMSWDVRKPTESGMVSTPRPLITLTHRGALASTNSVPFKFPMGFSVEVAHAFDNQNIDPIVPSDLQPAYVDAGGANQVRYARDAPWVGKVVTIQIGVQPTGTPDQYDVYIAMTPKDAFLPANGDPSGAEFAYWTAGGGSYDVTNANYFTAAHLTIARKDLARSVITLGRWNCGNLGFAELQPRMLVDKVRFYGTAASGNLPLTNGGILTNRDGKLEGTNVLPQRELTLQDITQELGPGLFAVDVVDGSATVTAGSGLRFFTGEARTTLKAVKGTYLYVPGEQRAILNEGTFGTTQDQFYGVTAVAADGSTMTLANPYQDATRKAAWAASLRLLAYTAFADDIRDKAMTLGVGKAFVPGTTTVADVVMTDTFWENTCPLDADWRLRVYSPLGRTQLSAIVPYWTRGLVSPRSNPILGIHGFNQKTYAAVQGALFEADDRWKIDGPNDSITRCLSFRGTRISHDILAPEANDRVYFPTPFSYAPNANDSERWDFDAWVWLEETGEYQTILTVMGESTDPSQLAVTSHAFHLAVRFNKGRPQFVLGSSAAYSGGAFPEKGLYIATGAAPIPVRTWTHVRWALVTRTTTAQVIMLPKLAVNGRKMSVAVSAQQITGAVDPTLDWLRVDTLGAQAGLRTFLGAARDAFRTTLSSRPFTGSAVGLNVHPNRLCGWMHPLHGKLAACVVSKSATWTNSNLGADMPDFDPHALTYSGATKVFNALTTPEGVGHKVFNSVAAEYGTIFSHPFVSVFHELGSGTNPASWAEFGNDLFVTTGGKTARVNAIYAGLAGVPAPTTELDFAIEKFPIWKPNVRSANANGVVNENPENDPIIQAVAGAALQIDHFDSHGNVYLRAGLDAADQALVQWKKATSGSAPRMIAFKGYVKPRDITGREILCAFRANDDSGGFFVESRDGHIAIGWYDTYLKRTVYVDTGAQVFRAGHWHYVNVRKETPQAETWQGNWVNSFFTNGTIRRATFATVGAGSISRGTLWTGAAGPGATGWIFYGDIPGGAGSYPAGGLTFLEYLRVGPEETGADTSATWAGSTGTNDPGAAIRPMHDSAVVRWFPKTLETYTDPTKNDALMAHVGVVASFALGGGSPDAAAGTTLTDAGGRTYKILWAMPSEGSGFQTLCVYAYGASDYTLAANITGGGSTFTGRTFIAVDGQTDGSYTNCISFVHDAYQIPGTGATGCVTQPFAGAIFRGTAVGTVFLVTTAGTPGAGTARCFHPDMVGMYWVWGSGTVTGPNIGKLFRITAVDAAMLRIQVVDPLTGAAPDFTAFAASQQGGVFMGVALRKSEQFDSSKEPDSTLNQPRVFGHEDAAFAFSGIAPFNGEYDSFGFTLAGQQAAGEDFRPFENRDSTRAGGAAGADPIAIGSDRFQAPIFAGSLAPERLRFDDWAATAGGLGTFDCVNGREYAGAPATVASVQPTFVTPNWTITPPTVDPAVGTTDTWIFGFLQDRSLIDGTTRYFRVAYYDIDQDSLSAPGPAIAVKADKEDFLNPAGQLRFTIKNLGAPRRRGNFEVWLYMGLAQGDATTMFRVARVPAGAAEVAISLSETEIATFAPLSLLSGEPPRCALVAASGGRMFYGALESDPSITAFSEAGLPVSIDFETPALISLGGGAGDRVTLLTEIDGILLIGKRNAIAIVTIDAQTNVAVPTTVSHGMGCSAPASVASLDGRVYLLSDAGVSLLTRSGNTNLSAPITVSDNVITLFQDEVDRADDLAYVACVYRPRGQYILLYRQLDEHEQDRRLSVEMVTTAADQTLLPYQPDRHRFAKCQGPRLSAIASVRDVSGGFELLIGGTVEGFLVYLDRPDTQLHLMGTDTALWGLSSLTTSAAAQSVSQAVTTAAPLANELLEGQRGTVARYVDAGGVERAVYVLFTSGTSVFFDKPTAVAPQSNQALTIGGQNHHWESKWLSLDVPQFLKNLAYLDFLFKRQGSGTLDASMRHDWDETTEVGDASVDLTIGATEYPFGNAEGYWFKLLLDSPQLVVGTSWDLSGIMWRSKDQDQD